MLEKELKRNGLPLSVLHKKEWIEVIFKKYTINALEDLYAMIGYGGLATTKVITRLKEEYRKTEKTDVSDFPLIETAVKRPKSNSTNGIVVRGIDNCLVRFSRCCNPVPGDEIVGYITRGRGVSVHRKDCVNVRNLENTALQEGERFIDVWWDDDHKSSFYTDIQIVANDRQGLVLEATNAVSESKISMHAINARSTKDGLAIINITLEITNKEQLEKIIKRFWKIENVISVIRKKQ